MPATIAKHPIHPMLIVFPIGLWVFSLVADLIFRYGGGNPTWHDLAFYSMLGGLIGALAAAVPGLIDYFSLSESAAKRIATRHMTINLIVVALYGVNLWLRMGDRSAAGWPLALSVAGVVLLAISGWLGGELVYVHGVGVEEKSQTARAPRVRRPVATFRGSETNAGKEDRL